MDRTARAHAIIDRAVSLFLAYSPDGARLPVGVYQLDHHDCTITLMMDDASNMVLAITGQGGVVLFKATIQDGETDVAICEAAGWDQWFTAPVN